MHLATLGHWSAIDRGMKAPHIDELSTILATVKEARFRSTVTSIPKAEHAGRGLQQCIFFLIGGLTP